MPILDFIRSLREKGRVELALPQQTEPASAYAVLEHYLLAAYEQEAKVLPRPLPPFEAQAALWAAALIQRCALAILDRQQSAKDLALAFGSYEPQPQASAMLSADLCLRYLPALYQKLQELGPEDPLLPHLRDLGQIWHYSALGLPGLDLPSLDLNPLQASPALRLAYLDRLLERRAWAYRQVPYLEAELQAHLGEAGQPLLV